MIVEKLVDIYEKDGRYNEAINYQDGLTVMLFVGVNGVGKTTSIGKLAYRYKQEGKKSCWWQQIPSEQGLWLS